MFRHLGRGSRRRGPMLRDNPTDPPGGPTDPPTVVPPTPPVPVPPVVPPPTPPAFDPESSPEAKAWAAKVKADAEARARTGSKDNARKETIAEIAKALGLEPAQVDPAKLATEHAAAIERANRVERERAVERAARAHGGDEDLTVAVLGHGGRLGELDPTASDFAAKVDALVKETIDANPKLKAGPVTPPPPAGGTGAPGSLNGDPGRTRAPDLTSAIGAALAAKRQQ